MRKIHLRRRWAVLVLAVLASLVAMGWLYLRPSSSPGLDPAVTSATAPKPRLRVGPRARAAQNVESSPDHPAPPGVKLPPVLQKALDANPHLAQYYRLEQKVLPSEDERNTLRDMFSDVELIEKIKHDLLAEESTYSKEVEAKRMVAVEFLTDAVAWGDNPAMPAVMEVIEGVVFAQNISTATPEDLVQSLAGDKMELYTQMLHSAPDRAAILAGHAQGKDVEALLTYSKDWYDREMSAMKADEIH